MNDNVESQPIPLIRESLDLFSIFKEIKNADERANLIALARAIIARQSQTDQ